MRFPVSSFSLLLGLTLVNQLLAANTGDQVYQSFQSEVEPILDSYCYDCHGFGTNKGGVTLDEFSPKTIQDHELWLRVLKNARAHIMPPQEEFQPSAEERDRLLTWIKTGPFALDLENPDPGKLTVQRLNRIEYQNTIRDLMGVEFVAADAFPADDSGEGFDNIGDILTLSPMLIEKYLDAANQIISEAVPTTARILPEHVLADEALVELFSPPTLEDDESKDDLQLSFYSPSSRTASYEIKTPGKYQVVLNLKPVSFSSFNGFDYNRCRLVFKIDGETKIEQEFEYISGKTFEYTFDYDWKPGEKRFEFEVEPLTFDLEKIKRLKMRIEKLTVRGPYAREHWIQPKNYDRFFPGGVPQEKSLRTDYTRRLLRDFTSRAYRRPVDEETVDQLTRLAQQVASQEGFTYEMGVSQAMVAILASPRFLFRQEAALEETAKDKYPLIDEFSLASRLSYFLWSSMPDEALFRLAREGTLRENLDTQLKRMMADKRSDAFIKNFSGQWLHARDIESVNISSLDVWLRDHPNPDARAAREEYSLLREIPDALRTPEQQEAYTRTRTLVRALYDEDRPELKPPLQRAMRQETELYFEHIIREDRNLSELLDSDYTFLNDRLATHYAIEGVEGSKFRKVSLAPGSPRGGILTQGTILAYTSNPTRTSPVKRGVFILENILGTPPAAPPPNIPSLEDVANGKDIEAMSLRETLALHREDTLCRSCHNRMDPLGLALENFNAMGIWRDAELSQPIETDGTLITGESFSSIQEMKRILANERIVDFYYCLSEKLLTYALGRGMEYYDTATIDELVETLKQSEGRPSALLAAIVHSAPFQKRRNTNVNSHQPMNRPAFNNPLNRRRFLKGVGASLALPALQSIVPTGLLAAGPVKQLATTRTGAPLRAAYVFFPNGAIPDLWWPKGEGANFSFKDTLTPLEPIRDSIQVMGGLDQLNATAGKDGGGDHARGNSVFLTSVRIKKSATDFRAGTSIDQAIAKEVGHLTRFPSLELSCDPARRSGACDTGYSCAYQYNLSWKTATNPMTPESNPRKVFERLFGEGSHGERAENAKRRMMNRRSILDFVMSDAQRMQKSLDHRDREKLDQYLTGIREVESRIENLERFGAGIDPDIATPDGIPFSHGEHIDIMFEMALLAFQTDSTRIATLLLAHDGDNRSHDEIGIPEGHHELTHHQNKADRIAKVARIDQWYVQKLASFLTRLDSIDDIDGNSMLHNSMIVYGSGNADGNQHTHDNLPIILAGHGGGTLNPGRFNQNGSTPAANLFLSMADRMGVKNLPRFGDSTGRLSNV